jgi:TolB-like protein
MVVLLVVAAAFAYFSRTRTMTAAPPPLTAGQTTLAVVPFRSIENGSAQDYFADGMTQALISSLARLRKVRAVSMVPNPAAAPAPHGRPSYATGLCAGYSPGASAGGRVRIDAQLIARRLLAGTVLLEPPDGRRPPKSHQALPARH